MRLYSMSQSSSRERARLDVYVYGDDADRDAGDACGDVFPSVRPRTASSASRASARAYSSTTSGRSPYGVTLRAKRDRRQSPRERDSTRPVSSGVFFSRVDAFSGARCVPTRWIRSLGALRVSPRRLEIFRSSSSPAVASPATHETQKKANNTSATSFLFDSPSPRRVASSCFAHPPLAKLMENNPTTIRGASSSVSPRASIACRDRTVTNPSSRSLFASVDAAAPMTIDRRPFLASTRAVRSV